MLQRNRTSGIAETYFDLPVLRYSLLYLISEQIDRTKAFAFTELG